MFFRVYLVKLNAKNNCRVHQIYVFGGRFGEVEQIFIIFAAENKKSKDMIIGREEEVRELQSLLETNRSEFVAVYGRRRVGKTYLIRESFGYNFAFQHSGMQDVAMAEQLQEFKHSLLQAGMKKVGRLKNWSEAFFTLGQHLTTLPKGKKVIFIDELPWLDTPNSKFVSALEHFWNGWASARKDILLVVCGSATSWIISKIVMNYGGLHNRLTRQIYLAPFTLRECEQYAKIRGLAMSRQNILETYMVIGGIPFYWDFMRKNLSWAQNIDRMFFQKNGTLRHEFNALYASLFRNPKDYINVIKTLETKKMGMTRNEIMSSMNTIQGGTLTKILKELEECDFIRSFSSIGKTKKETIYQLIDNFTLFYFKFLEKRNINDSNFWSQTLNKPIYNTWCGIAFERVCIWHLAQIKKALGISGIISNVYSWIYRPKDKEEKGVQIDMLIDRDDNMINLCEIKFSRSEYEINADYEQELQRKTDVFIRKLGTRKGVSTIMITANGLKRNSHSGDIQRSINLNDLFLEL